MKEMEIIRGQLADFRKKNGARARIPEHIEKSILTLYAADKKRGVPNEVFADRVGLAETTLYRMLNGRTKQRLTETKTAPVVKKRKKKSVTKSALPTRGSLRSATLISKKESKRRDEVTVTKPTGVAPLRAQVERILREVHELHISSTTSGISNALRSAGDNLRDALHTLIDVEYSGPAPVTHIGTKKLDEQRAATPA